MSVWGRPRVWGSWFTTIMVGVSLNTAALGQQAPSSSDAEWKRQVEERMAALERENAELKKTVGQINETRNAVMQDAAARSQAQGPFAGPRPSLTTPADLDQKKYVAEGNFPGSITIPGTNVSIQIGGFVQLDAIVDTNTIGSKDSFVVSSIPTNGESAGQTSFSVRQTRLFVKTNTPTQLGSFITYVEGDFFGPDGTDFRLRHAYGQIGDTQQVLAGQTYSTFVDASTYPAIFDYQGPNGMVLVRQPMIRYTHKLPGDVQWQVALEDPNPDLSRAAPLDGNGTSVWPDFISNVRWSPDWGHLQLAGILRELTFDPEDGPRSTELGWGLNFSGLINVCEPVAEGKQDNIVFQLAGGEGIANYFNDSSGLGLDGFVNGGGDLDALCIWGGFAAYQHYWGPKWSTTVGYSYLEVDDTSGQGDDTYESGHYVVANIMYYPVERIILGLEALYGIRKDQNGDTGDDGRLSFSIQYRF